MPRRTKPPSVTLTGFTYTLTGTTLTLIFTLSAAPSADFPVTLTISPTNPGGFPGLVTIPAGMTNYQVALIAPPGGGNVYTVTASAGGVNIASQMMLP